jgi:hypothetical protein
MVNEDVFAPLTHLYDAPENVGTVFQAIAYPIQFVEGFGTIQFNFISVEDCTEQVSDDGHTVPPDVDVPVVQDVKAEKGES